MRALFAGESPATGGEPLEPDVLIGTSAGAMNAAVVLAQEVRLGGLVAATDELRRIWVDRIAEGADRCGNGVYRIRGLPFQFFDRHCLECGFAPLLADISEDAAVLLRNAMRSAAGFVLAPERRLRNLARSINLTELISTFPFYESLREFLPLEALDRSRRRIRIVAMDLTTGKVRLFNEGDIRQLGYLPLLASTALPVFFPPRVIDGHYFINGTALANTPLLPAIAESDEMHIVYMDPAVRNISRERLSNVVDAIDRVMIVNFAYALNRDIQLAREINVALEQIEAGTPAEQLTLLDLHALLRTLARIRRREREGNPYRKLTIHRYHPRDDLGDDLGLMNLDRDRTIRIINRGYEDAVDHDCDRNACLRPDAPAGARPRTAVAMPGGPPEHLTLTEVGDGGVGRTGMLQVDHLPFDQAGTFNPSGPDAASLADPALPGRAPA